MRTGYGTAFCLHIRSKVKAHNRCVTAKQDQALTVASKAPKPSKHCRDPAASQPAVDPTLWGAGYV